METRDTKKKTSTSKRTTSASKKTDTKKVAVKKPVIKKTTSPKNGTVTKKVTTKKTVEKPIEEKNNKTTLLFMAILNVSIIGILVVGASFAYFMIDVSNDSQTTKIDMEIEDIGSVAFSSTDSNLRLDLKATEMLQLGSDVAYYASKNGATTTETTEHMGIISVAGNGVFDCTYAMQIEMSALSEETNMYKKFQNMAGKSRGQIVLTLQTQDGTFEYDFDDANLFTDNKIIYNGTAKGIKDGSPEAFLAQLKIVNKTGVVQDDLKGTDIVLSFTVETFSCEIVG